MFKREYDDLAPAEVETGVDLEDPYSGMQTSIFDMLDDAGRLCRWTGEADLVTCAENLAGD